MGGGGDGRLVGLDHVVEDRVWTKALGCGWKGVYGDDTAYSLSTIARKANDELQQVKYGLMTCVTLPPWRRQRPN